MDATELSEDTVSAPVDVGPEPHIAAFNEQRAAIDAIAASFVADDADPAPAAEETPAAEVTPPAEAAAAPAEAVAEATPAPAEAAADPGPEDRSLARIVEREVEIRRREDAVGARESEVAALQREVSELREASKSYRGDFQDQLQLKPSDALRAAGHDPEHVVRLILAEKMVAEGKPIPPELRTAIKEAEYDYKHRQLEQRQADYERQQQLAKWVHDIESGARTYLQGDYSKHAPTVATVAKANPDAAYRAIMDEIAADANDRAGRDQVVTVLPYEEAVKRAEKKLLALRSLFGTDPPAAVNAPTTKPARPVEAKGSSPTTPRPLVATKTLSAKELEEEGIKAAMAEFKRSEAARKAPPVTQ